MKIHDSNAGSFSRRDDDSLGSETLGFAKLISEKTHTLEQDSIGITVPCLNRMIPLCSHILFLGLFFWGITVFLILPLRSILWHDMESPMAQTANDRQEEDRLSTAAPSICEERSGRRVGHGGQNLKMQIFSSWGCLGS